VNRCRAVFEAAQFGGLFAAAPSRSGHGEVGVSDLIGRSAEI
jgi:hypothetical protein